MDSNAPVADGLIDDNILLSHLQQALLIVDSDFKIIRIEGAFEPTFHLARQSYAGKDVRSIGLKSEISDVIERLKSGQSSVIVRDIAVSQVLPHLDTIDISGIPLAQTEYFMLTIIPKKISGQVNDVTSDLSGAAMTVRGLSAMLAHEIKNPLSGIKGAAQLLARKVDEKSLKLTDMMVNEVDRISRLVNDLEGFTNPTDLNLEAVNVHVGLDQAIENLKAGLAKGINFDRIYDPSLPYVLGTEDALVQVFLNILKNAVEASPEGSTITVKSSYQHSLWLRNSTGDRKKVPIEVKISDEGSGISPEIKDHLFDPFITDKDGGTGLGLAVVAQNMLALGGIVKCEDNHPFGTAMYLYFQAAE